MATTRWPQALNVTVEFVGDTVVLDARGVLDETSYLALRDKIIQEALAEPRAVVIDVSGLDVPAESAWLVFSSARWQVDRWPHVPIGLVCHDETGRSAIAHSGIGDRVPVFATLEAAVRALGSTAVSQRRRARAELQPTPECLHRARELVADWLGAWSLTDLVPVTKIVVTEFVENVLRHTDSNPMIRLETDGAAVIVAVEDSSHTLAAVSEARASVAGIPPTGLRIVSAFCRMWANAPTSTGKTVWAMIGQENRL
ncbi:STAS domain-containing protein [Mycobacterium sp. MMS18-G62]